MIKISNVDFSYIRKRIFKNFDLEIDRGGVFGLLGENGTGKSTMLKLLSGMVAPQQGSINVMGCTPALRDEALYKNLFLVPEDFSLPQCSVKDYVKAFSVFYPNFSHEDMDKYLQLFKLNKDDILANMSMGQQKKSLIAFCFATNCKIMLLDEPTNGLDIPSKSAFRSIVAEKSSDDRLIIISTHQIRDVESILDSIAIINTQNLLLCSSIAKIESKLSFVSSIGVDDYIFKEGGVAIVLNDSTNDTQVDIETLFNAVLIDNRVITKILGE